MKPGSVRTVDALKGAHALKKRWGNQDNDFLANASHSLHVCPFADGWSLLAETSFGDFFFAIRKHHEIAPVV